MDRRPPRLVGLALLALSLAGCFDGGSSGSAGPRPYTAVARFVPGDEVSVIQVTVSDRQPLRGADLIGPDGAVIAAESVEARQGVESQQPSFNQPLGTDISNGVGLLRAGRLANGKLRADSIDRADPLERSSILFEGLAPLAGPSAHRRSP
jgi:hypothetical protein